MKMFRKLVSIVAAATVLTSSLAFSISAHAAQVDTTAVSSEPNTQDDVNNGVILHAFNWSYNSIKQNLPQIKAAGYSAVQTSPVTQPKDYGPWSDVSGQWPKLYQPVSESISNSSWLGTKEELAAMCQEADNYGIKIIVDIVANHMANYKNPSTGAVDANKLSDEVKTYEPDLYNNYSQYFHSERSGASDSSPQLMVQGHVSECPDLNTGNSFVQSKILGLLKECIDCGVDGFRFDAAKHIETEKDGSYGSQFWTNTLDQAKAYYKSKTGADLFAYGEILNGIGGRDITGYTGHMRVTENNYSDKILVGFNSGNTSLASATNYSLTRSAAKAVVWAESHDTYMGESGSAGLRTTSGVSDENVVKAWAVVTARQGSVPLYFARPGSSMMGEAAGDLTYKSTVVSEINKFHNAFANVASEKVGVDGGCVYVARGNAGVVLARANGFAGNVTVSGTGLADGVYVDTVTGSEFSVAGGKLSGSVGSTGVAVIYKSTATPKATASVESGNFTTDTITVQLSLENAVKGTYALENYAPTEFTGTTAIKIGRDYNVGETITLNLTATDAAGTTTTSTYFYNKKPSTTSGIFVFLNPSICKNWKNVCCYVYDEDTMNKKISYSNGGWPGQQMVYDETLGYWYIEIPARCVEQDAATGKVSESDFNLPQSPNTYVIFNGTNKSTNLITQYPGASVSANQKLKLGGGTSNKVLDAAKSSGWKDTAMTPTKTEIPAKEVLKGGAEVTTAPPTTQGTTAPPEPETKFVQEGIYGDVNLDGTVDISDVSAVQRHLAEFKLLEGTALKAADVDQDGDITVKDITFIQMYLAEFPDGFAHAGEPYGKYIVVEPGEKFNVTATSNLFAKNTVEFDANTDTFTVTYFINSEKELLTTDWALTYDSAAVTPQGDVFMPNISGVVCNKKDGKILGNYSNIRLDPLKADGNKPIPFVSATFRVKDTKDTTIDPTVKDLCVSILKSGDSASKAANETDVVENSEIKKPDSKYNLYTSVYAGSLNKNRDVTYDPNVFYDPAGGQPTTAPQPTVPAPSTRTILFTNNKGWSQVYLHYWGGADETAWPGIPMEYAGTNGYGEPQYSAEIPTDSTGLIFNDGQPEGGQQTVDVTYDNTASGWYPTAEKDEQGHWFVESWIADTPVPVPVPDPSTPTPGGTRRIEFTDNKGWGSVFIYYWGSAGGDPEWPGYSMNKIDGDNGYGGTNYWYDVPTDVTGIVFSGPEGQQTADVTYDNDATGWYPTDEQDAEGHWLTDSWKSEGGGGGGTRTVLFTDNKGWGGVNVHYWGGSSGDTEWPGVAMTPAGENDYGEMQYSYAVPTDIEGMVFNGSGGQTVDVMYDNSTTGWYPLDSKDGNGNYEVGSWTDGGSGGGTLTGSYFLVGYIDGEEYWGTDHPFSGGKCTMNFAETSYVFIRDEAGNAFMTNGWAGEDATSATLYSASITGEESNKLIAPAGEVTFTLSQNSDGTFTLSTGGGDIPVPPVPTDTRTIQFTNNGFWDAVYAYAWNDNGDLLGAWPGTAMEDMGDNGMGTGAHNYSVDIPTNATNIIFSNGTSWDAEGGEQTVDLIYNNTVSGWYTTDKADGKWLASNWTEGSSDKTVTLGIISYFGERDGYQIHWWDDAGNSGEVDTVSTGSTVQKSVGAAYWGGAAQTFYTYTAAIPASATGFRPHKGDFWPGENGPASASAAYLFNYDGDKVLYE